ncbi:MULTISPECIES: phage tail assembly chaperone [Novosphingobium]|uniref:Phage tail assembly chaperone protein, TAC n=1 Tax=Novosphingobium mathurense TaxID=428990 RepID=A0A1U6HET9_9SPHN|nr:MULTISPECIES: phage tail assembly chaperone [Novosphingobium]CDO36844.1 conserved hypothetical protein [Novosphingobium sp. KN65.2]SLJ94295.1 Phage tail assembly chaperone protein, TAC [Novosphingobium mathurense]
MSPSFGEHALALFAVAARHLGWRPDVFWAATPCELAAALRPPLPPAASGIDRAALQRLMENDHG